MRQTSNPEIHFRLPLNSDQKAFLGYLAEERFAREDLLWLRRPFQDMGFTVNLGWTPSKSWRVMRSLYGVIGVNESPYTTFPEGALGALADVFVYRRSIRYTNRRIYDSVEVPKSNRQSVARALRTDVFDKPMRIEDLDVLQAIFENTQAMQERFGTGFYPRYTPKELSSAVGESETATQAALVRLEGLVCRVGWASHHGFKIKRFRRGTKRDRYDEGYRLKVQYRPRWIVPKSREADILEILDQKQ